MAHPNPSNGPMKTADIRQRWLDYFAERGHTVVPSASLVSDDPSLLFTVAGMVPFVPYLTGLVPAPYPRATEQPENVAQKFLPGSLSLYPTLYRSGEYSQGSCLKVTLAPEEGGRE